MAGLSPGRGLGVGQDGTGGRLKSKAGFHERVQVAGRQALSTGSAHARFGKGTECGRSARHPEGGGVASLKRSLLAPPLGHRPSGMPWALGSAGLSVPWPPVLQGLLEWWGGTPGVPAAAHTPYEAGWGRCHLLWQPGLPPSLASPGLGLVHQECCGEQPRMGGGL